MIWLENPTIFWLGGGTISLSCSMYMGFSDVRQTEIHTAEPQVSEVEMAIEKLKRHKLPGIDQIPV